MNWEGNTLQDTINEQNRDIRSLRQKVAELEALMSDYEEGAKSKEWASIVKDAERYRWLREQHWNYSDLVVVTRPRQNVKLGSDCPCADRLDAAIDAAKESK